MLGNWITLLVVFSLTALLLGVITYPIFSSWKRSQIETKDKLRTVDLEILALKYGCEFVGEPSNFKFALPHVLEEYSTGRTEVFNVIKRYINRIEITVFDLSISTGGKNRQNEKLLTGIVGDYGDSNFPEFILHKNSEQISDDYRLPVQLQPSWLGEKVSVSFVPWEVDTDKILDWIETRDQLGFLIGVPSFEMMRVRPSYVELYFQEQFRADDRFFEALMIRSEILSTFGDPDAWEKWKLKNTWDQG